MNNEKEEKKTVEATGPPDQFVGRDLLESYMYYRNYIPSNPIEAYNIKRKCIEFGKELLPSFIDPDEKDEKEIKKNNEEQDKTDKLYKDACTALIDETIKKRKITYTYLDKNQYVYELTATDADECTAVKEEFETMKNNFINQQHEQHMGALTVIDNQIFHVLSMTGIVPAINPTSDQLVEGETKAIFREINQVLEEGDALPSAIMESDEDDG